MTQILNRREPLTFTTSGEATQQKFARLAREIGPRIFRFLLASMRNVDLAETLTQDCLVRACSNWRNFRGDSSPATWFMRIAINLQKDYWRSRRAQFWRQTQTHGVETNAARDWLANPAPSIEARLVAKEQIRRVLSIVDTLCDNQKKVFLMRYFQDLKLREIADATGMREGTVKAHLSRALTKIRSELRLVNTASLNVSKSPFLRDVRGDH